MSQSRTPIGFKAQISTSPVAHVGKDKLVALLELTEALDNQMQDHAKGVLRSKPFFEVKKSKLEIVLNKFYIKYYEPF